MCCTIYKNMTLVSSCARRTTRVGAMRRIHTILSGILALLVVTNVVEAGAASSERTATIRAIDVKFKRTRLLQRHSPRLLEEHDRRSTDEAGKGQQLLASTAGLSGPLTSQIQSGKPSQQNVFQRAYFAYSRALEEKPLFTKIWSAAVVSAIGNLLAQAFAADTRIWLFHIDDVNFEEMLTYAAVGAFYFAPLTHFWFQKLAHLVHSIPQLRVTSDMTRAVAMMAMDQSVGAVVANAGFLLLYGIIDRMTNMDLVMKEPPMVTIFRRVKTQLWPVLLMNWCVWPAANLLNFYAVPHRFRVLYTNIVGALWSIYLSNVVSPPK